MQVNVSMRTDSDRYPTSQPGNGGLDTVTELHEGDKAHEVNLNHDIDV